MARKKHRNQPNIDRWRAMHELRRSNAAQPHRNRKRYHRPSQRRPAEDDS